MKKLEFRSRIYQFAKYPMSAGCGDDEKLYARCKVVRASSTDTQGDTGSRIIHLRYKNTIIFI